MVKEIEKLPYKLEVIAPLRESASLGEMAKALDLPPESERQPDLQYLTAVFVSSGMNKNGAVFMGSELVKARKTIPGKAVDIEHDEQTVIGHITNSVYLTRDGDTFDAETASTKMSDDVMDSTEMDVAISATIYKARFPEIATEILQGKWQVSMEAFYRDYDVKVGDMIVPREQAEELGYDQMVGRVVKLKDGDKELGFHLVGRVLRDIIFAGVGVVKNPANDRSVILEAASMNDFINHKKEEEGVAATINLADIETIEVSSMDKEAGNNTKELIMEEVEKLLDDKLSVVLEKTKEVPEKASDLEPNAVRPGTCVNFKKYVYEYPDGTIVDPETELTQVPLKNNTGTDAENTEAAVARENYCNLFDLDCAARPGDATLPTCWRNVFARTVRDEIFKHEQVLRETRVEEGLMELQRFIDEVRKFKY